MSDIEKFVEKISKEFTKEPIKVIPNKENGTITIQCEHYNPFTNITDYRTFVLDTKYLGYFQTRWDLNILDLERWLIDNAKRNYKGYYYQRHNEHPIHVWDMSYLFDKYGVTPKREILVEDFVNEVKD